jgi:phosphoserine aminotransferase
MSRIYNFSAGPATLPTEVLEQARDELLDWHGIGMSIMEISHRGKEFMEVAAEAEKDLRELMQIPQNYKVLFLQGGARLQFAMVPMNLLRGKKTADYINTGVWSKLAIQQAQQYCEVNVAASSEDSAFTTIPEKKTWRLNPNAAYLHIVSNETVNGVEFPIALENSSEVPLVADMSSNILSRSINVSNYGLIYAGAQKNIGLSGLTVVIVREDLLGNPLAFTPIMLNYKIHADNNSLYNTPPTFAWYLSGLVFKWLKKQGGVEAIAKINQHKSEKLYRYIDSSHFYKNNIDPKYRSTMNVIFTLPKEELNEAFLKEAKAAGLAGLKGHKLLGGMRASLYNAVSEKAVDTLIAFMQEFELFA